MKNIFRVLSVVLIIFILIPVSRSYAFYPYPENVISYLFPGETITIGLKSTYSPKGNCKVYVRPKQETPRKDYYLDFKIYASAEKTNLILSDTALGRTDPASGQDITISNSSSEWSRVIEFTNNTPTIWVIVGRTLPVNDVYYIVDGEQHLSPDLPINVIQPEKNNIEMPKKVVYKINSMNPTKALAVILNNNGIKEPVGVLNLNTITQWNLSPDPQGIAFNHDLPEVEPGIYVLEFYETHPGTGKLERLIYEYEFIYDPTGSIGDNKYLYKDKIMLMNVMHQKKSDLVVSVMAANKVTGRVEPGHIQVSVMSTVNGQLQQVDFGKEYPNTGIWQTIVGWVTGKAPKAQFYDYTMKIEFDYSKHESDNGWKYVKNTEEILVVVGYTNAAGDFIVANHHKIPAGSIIGPQGYESSHGTIDTEEQPPDEDGQYINDPDDPVEQTDNADHMNAENGILGFFVALNGLFAAIIALIVKIFRLLSSLLFIDPDPTHIHSGILNGLNLIRDFSILGIGIWNAISSVLVFGYVLGVIKLVRKTF